MNTTVALFPEDRPRFVVGADTFLDGVRSPFLAVHANSAGVCLTYHGISRDELQALADRILAYLSVAPDAPDSDPWADEEAAMAESRQAALVKINQLVADISALHSPTGTSPA